MNDVISLFRNRRSVRKYDGTPIKEELLKQVLEAGIIAPTGDNYRTTEFLLIQDHDTLHEIAHTRKVGARMLDMAGAAILVLADAGKSDLWIEDAAIAMAYMHLAADALGLGSCWIQMRAREDVNGDDMEAWLRIRFGIPDHIKPLAILSLGNIEKTPAARKNRTPDWNKIHKEKY